MPKRKPPTSTSESHPGQEKQKRNRLKHSISSANKVEASEVRSMNSISDASESERKRGKDFISSNTNLDVIGEKGHDSLSRSTEPVLMAKTRESVTPSDESLCRTGKVSSQTVENHREVNVVQKKVKRKKGHTACGKDPCQCLPEEVSPCNLQGNSELQTAEMDTVRENIKEASTSENVMSPVEKENGVSENADADSVENYATTTAINSPKIENTSSMQTKRVKQKGKKKSSGNQVKEDVPSPSLQAVRIRSSADSQSLSNIVDVDLVRKNNTEASTSDSLMTISEKDDIGLTISANADSIVPGINSNSPKVKSKRPNKKGNFKSDFSDSIQEDIHSPSLKVALNSTSGSSSSSGTAEVDLVKNSSEASISGNLMLLAFEEGSGLSKNANAEMVKKGGVPPEIDSNSNELKNTNSKQRKKKGRRGKNKSSDANSAVCPSSSFAQCSSSANGSSLSRIAEMGIERKICVGASSSSDLVSMVEKDHSALTEAAYANLMNKSDISHEIISNSDVIRNTNLNGHKKKKRKGKKKFYDFSQYNTMLDQSVPSNNSSSLLINEEMELECKNSVDASNLLPIADKENSVLTSADADLPNKSNFSAEINSNSYEVNNLISIHIQNAIEEETDKSLDCSEHDIKQARADVPCASLQVVKHGDANSYGEAPASVEVKRRTREKKVKHAVYEKRVSEGLVDKFQKAPHGCVMSAEGNLKVLPTDRKEVVSLPPSPIRGVIDDFASSDLPNKENSPLDCRKKEDTSFSFQIEQKDSIELQRCHVLTEVSTGCPEEKGPSSSVSYITEDVFSSDVINNQDYRLKSVIVSPERALISHTRKKLLVLDLNGLLADVVIDFRNVHKADKKVRGKSVFKRPFCDDFLKFCFERFDIGVWSSRRECNVDDVVDYLMGDTKHKLLFCWGQSKCTITGFNTIESTHKPLFLKELKKLWNKEEPDLPWAKGEYSPSNTLLVDDSPYKALCNPPHTAIFPCPYHFNDENDNSLGPGGDIRVYLEGLAMADDVQQFVQEHPFGQCAITDANPSWKFYLRIIDKVESSSAPTR